MAAAVESPAPSAAAAGPSGETFATTRNLGARYYHDPAIFAREQRTIFSKTWLFLTNVSRVAAAAEGSGEAETPEGDGALREGHAHWPGVGRVKVLLCKIAGFEFALRPGATSTTVDGLLLSSPVPEHSASLPRAIRAHATQPGGWVFVNLAPEEEKVVPCTEFLAGLEGGRLKEIDWEEYSFDGEFSIAGSFNWKAYVDNFQECYHCPTGHAVTFASYALQTYKIINTGNYSQHFCERKADLGKRRPSKGDGLGGGQGLWLFFYPNASMSCYAPAISMSIINPVSPTRTVLYYQVFMRRGTPPATRDAFYASLREVLAEDCELTGGAQRNYEGGVWAAGPLHPGRENGVLWFQNKVREALKG
ncbi:hypothetical protein DFJ74DRAFT_662904 [Hyaloraphidium curvatum]|nr:hypothetical protein DFJ74DRAFT_662904 [Hyaloraphidium curvatum]